MSLWGGLGVSLAPKEAARPDSWREEACLPKAEAVEGHDEREALVAGCLGSGSCDVVYVVYMCQVQDCHELAATAQGGHQCQSSLRVVTEEMSRCRCQVAACRCVVA